MLAKLVAISILLLSISAYADVSKPDDEQQLRLAILAAETQFDSNTMALTPAGMQSLQGLIAKLEGKIQSISVVATR